MSHAPSVAKIASSAFYYNEIDPYAAQWLRNLIAAGHIPAGVVDERSIEDITPDELRPYTQCHFFAGIAGWSHALALAGWPSDRPVWTGSCPCQPFSAAGKGAGFDDQRHLWPAWFHLIRECRPAVILGEQVASKDAEPWVDLVHADLESVGYAFGCVPFPAAGIGAPHIRDRNYWVAHADSAVAEQPARARTVSDEAEGPGTYGKPYGRSNAGRLGLGGLADTSHGAGHGSEPRAVVGLDAQGAGTVQTEHGHAGPTNGFWRNADWLLCRDGKWRPVEPGTFPLAHAPPGRVGRLRAYGNAISPFPASEMIAAYLECRP